MSIIIFAFTTALFLILLVPWLALLATPVVTASATLAGLPVVAVGRLRRLLSRAPARAPSGILCVEGLKEAPEAASELTADIARVLDLAPAGTRAKACTCVQRTDAGYVAVLRVYNAKGHYLLRKTGASLTAVAASLTGELRRFRNEFPAPIGARRIRCAECNSAVCPLRRLAQQRVRAAA